MIVSLRQAVGTAVEERSGPLLEKIGQFAATAGRGALAGLAGTALMTVSSMVEMKIRGREPSTVPAKAAGRVLGVQPRDPQGAKRFTNYVHWTYGMAWGAAGGMLHEILDEEVATAAHLASVWGTELVMLPQMEVTPPVPEWGWGEVAIDLFHHVVYAVGVAAALRVLTPEPETGLSRLTSGLRELLAA